MKKSTKLPTQRGGSIKFQPGPNNPFNVQEKQIPAPPYQNNTQNFNPTTPPYNPHNSNQQKPSTVYKNRSPHMKEPTATINLYPPQPPPKPIGLSTTSSPYLPFSMSHYNPSGFPKLYNPYGPQLNEQYYNPGGEHAIPIGFIKNYNIFTDNIKDYQTKYMPIIYEDSIPMRGAKHELTTLSERILLYEYVQNNLVSYEEGEEGCLNHNRGINLLRQLKYLSPHPVNYNILYSNPLQGLKKGIRIYRSCYPISVDRTNKTICQKGSLGLHIRFYDKHYFDHELLRKQQANLQQRNTISDMMRELQFYRWIRNNILLKKVCPNFVMLYTYYNCMSCNEPFNELDRSKIVRPMPTPFTINIKPKGFLKHSPNIKLNKQCLVLITEAPNMNILEWMTNERSYAFNKRVHTNYGYHTAEVWYSIYFQIWAALYTLQQNDIIIMELGYDNIWIKDIPTVGYWKYIINNITYYVPNYGYLVIIDCSFQNKIHNITYPTIISKSLFGDSNEQIRGILPNEIWKNIITDDPFGRGYVNASVKLPPREILTMIQTCSTDLRDHNFDHPSDIFLNHMTIYLHNRIGTPLNNQEQQTIDLELTSYIDLVNYNKGELVVYIDDEQQQTSWALYLGNNKLCIRKNKTNRIIKDNISASDIRKVNLSPDSIGQHHIGISSETITDLSAPPLATYNLG